MPMTLKQKQAWIDGPSTHFAGCWRYGRHWRCAVALVEELAAALKANMDWIGAPPADKESFDSVREDAWKKGKVALAKVEEANSA